MDLRVRENSRLRLKRKKERFGRKFWRWAIGVLLAVFAIYLVAAYNVPLAISPDVESAATEETAVESPTAESTDVESADAESADAESAAAESPDADSNAGPEVIVVESKAPAAAMAASQSYDKKELSAIIGPRAFQPDELYTFRIEDDQGAALFVRTTMDPELQAWAVEIVQGVKAAAVAIVALDPATGQVLSLASHRTDGDDANPALTSSFPAASLFKIVTAAAAVEQEEMSSGSTLAYDGQKHTLYKSQLDKDADKGSHKVTLEEGFADSINPVFGKLGAFNLGPKALESFAERFHFNQPIDFEMPVQASNFAANATDDPFRLAELASGFNRTTTVSPLHGAMLASAIVNNGQLMEPTVVREVFDMDNHIYYKHQPKSLGQVVSEHTIEELRKLMQATVSEGTGRKRFHDAASHPILSKLEIGGKSGTINDDQGRKVDWFVCYAIPKKGGPPLALSAVVVHNPKLGTRSQELVREALIHFYAGKLKEGK